MRFVQAQAESGRALLTDMLLRARNHGLLGWEFLALTRIRIPAATKLNAHDVRKR